MFFYSGIFLGQNLGRNMAHSQLKNEQKQLPKMVYIIPNFLVLHFDENPNKKNQSTDAWNFA